MIEGETLTKFNKELDNYISNVNIVSEEIVNAYCNDCNIHFDIKYHPFGLKCTTCGGYNTRL
jgi:hypothetical protein